VYKAFHGLRCAKPAFYLSIFVPLRILVPVFLSFVVHEEMDSVLFYLLEEDGLGQFDFFSVGLHLDRLGCIYGVHLVIGKLMKRLLFARSIYVACFLRTSSVC